MIAYYITGWDSNYDPPAAQHHERLTWVRFPNQFDTLTYRRMANEVMAPELFTAWVLMVQIASRTKYRGWLVREGKPLQPSDMALMTGFQADIFNQALVYFSDENIGWIRKSKIINVKKHKGEKNVFLVGDTLEMENIQNAYPKRISTMDTLIAISSAAERESERSEISLQEALKKINKAVLAYSDYTSGWSPADRRNRIPSPVTWFHEDRWLDKDSWGSNGHKKTGKAKPSDTQMKL